MSNIYTIEVAESYWNGRWQNKETGWDIGAAAPALMQYAAQIENKKASILVPGCGNAHEAHALLALGFTNITIIDIAPIVVAELKKMFEGNTAITIVEGDFFALQKKYDYIIEQTFFCALLPEQRPHYVQQMAAIMHEQSQLFGLLFNTDFGGRPGPAFGGSIEEYKPLFAKHFNIIKMENCYNSIAPRANKELFFICTKK